MIKSDDSIDLSGVPCPANAARLILRLESLESQKVLEIIVDDGEPAKNVLDSIIQEGHKLLKKEKTDKSWKVWVRKV
jgi:TusA-related sulfurtransferase